MSERLSDERMKLLAIHPGYVTINEARAMAEELKERRDADVSRFASLNEAASAISITPEEMKIAQENPHYFCYTGSHMPEQHEVGCSHKTWSIADLQSALNTSKAVLRIYQHRIFGTSLR